ncbi:MAG: HAMP domain-containing protein [Alphaproteobacteria bacterium]|nr:HAMP domain-containing protein [Alphaproteobacteria bacterium]
MTHWLNRLRPNRIFSTIFAQTFAVLLTGLAASYALGWWFYSSDRARVIRETGGFAIAQRIANAASLIEDAPAEWRARIVAAINTPAFRIAVVREQPGLEARDGDSEVFARFLAEAMGADMAGRKILARAGDRDDASPPWAGYRYFNREGQPEWRRGGMRWREGDEREGIMRGRGMRGYGPPGGGLRELQAAIELKSGEWLSVSTLAPASASAPSQQFLLMFALMALTILALTAFVVRRLTRPLVALSHAAQAVGRDLNAPPLQMSGSAETRQAAHAFNDMQTRLRALIENRTRMLAAISHDLRTPLTSLRLRAENVADESERKKMLAAIAQMDQLISSALDLARDGAQAEAVSMVDITALVQSTVDDLADAGLAAAMQDTPALTGMCRPAALRRVLENLVGNAVKYGERARISAGRSGQDIWISVDDDGPGIAPQDMARVFEPFVRLDESRSEAGGVGLGLTIVRALAEAQGGRIKLENRQGADCKITGLRASIILPQS